MYTERLITLRPTVDLCDALPGVAWFNALEPAERRKWLDVSELAQASARPQGAHAADCLPQLRQLGPLAPRGAHSARPSPHTRDGA